MLPGQGSTIGRGTVYISNWLTHNVVKNRLRYQRSSVTQKTLCCSPVAGISLPRDRIKENIPNASEPWEIDGIDCSRIAQTED